MNPVLKPVRIGNSKGVRIPANLIRSYHLERGFTMKAVQDGILIAPAATSKLTLEESFAEMAEDRADLKIAREWAENGISDGIEEDSGY
jgi:antitoxin component of MazEF toxin-antitoxin module